MVARILASGAKLTRPAILMGLRMPGPNDATLRLASQGSVPRFKRHRQAWGRKPGPASSQNVSPLFFFPPYRSEGMTDVPSLAGSARVPSPHRTRPAMRRVSAARQCKWRRLTSATGLPSGLSRDSGQAEAPPHSKDGEGSPFDMRGEYAKRRHEYPGHESPSAISLSRQYARSQTIYDRLRDALRVPARIQALMDRGLRLKMPVHR